MEYSEEPRLVFSPLSAKDYSDFYSLEMAAFSEDVPFYVSLLQTTDRVLELGCGSGRLTHLLADHCKAVTGIDISKEMIDLAKAHNTPQANLTFIQADMLELSTSSKYDVVIIPYNTLNLLGESTRVEKCLRICRQLLSPEGRLLLHLYHPDTKIIQSGKSRIFQFAILERENGDKIIKETLKSYSSAEHILTMEERYRVRPKDQPRKNRDLNHTLKLYAPPMHRWKELLRTAGFKIAASWGSYTQQPFDETTDNMLLIRAAL